MVYKSLLSHRRGEPALAAGEGGDDSEEDDVDMADDDPNFEGAEGVYPSHERGEDDEGYDDGYPDESVHRLGDYRQAKSGLRRPPNKGRNEKEDRAKNCYGQASHLLDL